MILVGVESPNGVRVTGVIDGFDAPESRAEQATLDLVYCLCHAAARAISVREAHGECCPFPIILTIDGPEGEPHIDLLYLDAQDSWSADTVTERAVRENKTAYAVLLCLVSDGEDGTLNSTGLFMTRDGDRTMTAEFTTRIVHEEEEWRVLSVTPIAPRRDSNEFSQN